MHFLHGVDLTREIRRTVSVAPVDMAVAFWGGKAIERLDLPANLAGYRIACDARSGACSPTTLGTLIERGAALVDVPGLHAKVYWSPGGMVVASANASTNGLSEEVEVASGLEAGMATTDSGLLGDAHKWLNDTIKRGTEIRPEHLPEIALLWNSRRGNRPMRTTLANALLGNSRALSDRVERAYIYTTEEPPKGVKKRYRESDAFDAEAWKGDSWPFFWGDIEGTAAGDILVCFEIAGRALRWEGVWQVYPALPGKGVTIWPARELDQIQGMPIGDMAEVMRRVRAALRAGRLQPDVGPISLAAFAAALLPKFAADHLTRIQLEPIRDAYRLLLNAAPRLGLSTSDKTGVLPAVLLHDAEGRYVFSFNVNMRDLLFYLRDPALRASPGLVQRAALAGFTVEIPQERVPRPAPKTERQIRITSPDLAARLVSWLETELPLPPT